MDIYMSFSLKSLISFGRKIFTLIILMLLIHETEHRMSFQCTCMGKYWCFMYLCICVCMCISVDVCVWIYLFSSITFISVTYLNLFDWIFPRFFIVVIINGLFSWFFFHILCYWHKKMRTLLIFYTDFVPWNLVEFVY